MKFFKYIRKILILSELILSAALIIILCFAQINPSIKIGLLIVITLLFGIFCLSDYLHNRYLDDMLEQLAFLIEELVGNQEIHVFSELEDTLLSRLQHQLLKLRSVLLKQNNLLENEKNRLNP